MIQWDLFMETIENRTQISTNSTTTMSPLVVLGFAAITASVSPIVPLNDFVLDKSKASHETSFGAKIPSTMQDLIGFQMNRKFLALEEKLNQFKTLKKDWNGYDADPIPLPVLDAAKTFLQSLRAGNVDLNGWEVFPTARETVQFEKTVGNDYVEIEVYSNGRFALYSEGRENLEIESINMAETMEKISGVFG